jgi:hypothetical protein
MDTQTAIELWIQMSYTVLKSPVRTLEIQIIQRFKPTREKL